MQNFVNITYATVSDDSLDNIFGFRYQHHVIKLTRLWMVHIITPNLFYFLNELWNISLQYPLPKTKCIWHGVNFMMSTLQYNIVLRKTYKFQTIKYYCFDKVSANICPLCSTLFYVSSNTKIYFWHGDSFQKEIKMSPFHKHFTFYWFLDLFHPNLTILLCSSIR